MKEFNFDVVLEELPKEVIERVFIDTIRESSRGLLKASINSYSGHITSYETTDNFGLIASLGEKKTVYHNIQNELGELDKRYYTYELIIESVILKNYKYRVLFFRYGEAGYPVTVVVADAISRQLEIDCKGEKPYIYTINKHRELETLANAILCTKAIETTMQEAITASLLKKKQTELDDNKDN